MKLSGVSGQRTRVVLTADLDRNGSPDIVVGISGAANRYYLNPGSGDFSGVNPVSFGGADNTEALFVTDLNQDGFLDILEGNSGQTNKMHFGSDATGGSDKSPTAGYRITSSASIGTETADTRAISAGSLNSEDDDILDIVTGDFQDTNKASRA